MSAVSTRRHKLLTMEPRIAKEEITNMESRSILEEAAEIVDGPRQMAYGHPRDNFDRIAAFWSVVLGAPVSSQQVGLCMIGLKLARSAQEVNRDTLVDIAGYARAIEMLGDDDPTFDDLNHMFSEGSTMSIYPNTGLVTYRGPLPTPTVLVDKEVSSDSHWAPRAKGSGEYERSLSAREMSAFRENTLQFRRDVK